MGFRSWWRGDTTNGLSEHDSTTLPDLIVATQLQQQSLNTSRALAVAAVYRARQINADTLAALPVMAGASLVPAPNRFQDTQEFTSETVLSLQDHGDAYWHLTSTGMRVLPFERMTVSWNSNRVINRRRVYKFENQIMRTEGISRNLIVVSINRGANDLTGFGWLQSERIRGIIAEQNYSQTFFENQGTPTGVLKVPGALTKEEADLLKRQWDTAHTGVRSTAVISATMDYTPTSFSATDSDWVDAHLTSIGDVSNLSGVPAFLLAYSPPGSTQDYQNVETVRIRLWRETVEPTYAVRIQNAWTAAIETQVMFDPQSVFLSSMINRANSATLLVGVGYDAAGVLETVGLPDMSFTERRVDVATV